MKIGVLTFYKGDKFISDTKYGKKVLINYCNKYNYDFYDDIDDIINFDREMQWNKILMILKYLKLNKHDYIVWIDADIFIMNDNIQLESFIYRLMDDNHIMYSRDVGNWVNNGVIFIKNSKQSIEFFTETWNHTNQICREQGAMDYLYRINWNNCKNYITITQDETEYNPMWFQYKYGQFIMHFPGCNEVNRKPDSLKLMMNMFCPIKMDDESDEIYNNRINWLKYKAETELKCKKHLCNINGYKYLPIDLD
jgi:hypothetical protein